ncbi:MAG: 6-bladed beta-propeller, partial [Chloroflexi bacterium]|nr:6-bladed beta-propeller [Chloroflexota bacterium]
SIPLPSPTPGPVSFVWKITGEPEPLIAPTGLAMDKQGNLLAFDAGNGHILKYSPEGKVVTQWGSSGSGDGQFDLSPDPDYGNDDIPLGDMVVDAQGNIYVADAGNARIQKFDANGKFLVAWGKAGKGDGEFMRPICVALDAQGNVYVVADRLERIQKFDSAGKFLDKFGTTGTGDGQFVMPGYLAIDDQNNIYVPEWRSNRIKKLDGNGKFLAKWEKCGDSPILTPTSVAVDVQGNVYVAERGVPQGQTRGTGTRVCKFDRAGQFLYAWGGRGSGDGQFFSPTGVVVDKDGNVYVADTGNHRIQKFRQQ